MGFKVVKIEKVEDGYVVTSPGVTPLPPDWEPFFATFEEVITYIRFNFDEKAEDKQCHRFILLDILSSMEEK